MVKILVLLKRSKWICTKASLKYPAAKVYPELPTGGQVYFTNYDMVQMEMSKIGRGEEIKPANFGKINVFNEYFGRGLSSIVFRKSVNHVHWHILLT